MLRGKLRDTVKLAAECQRIQHILEIRADGRFYVLAVLIKKLAYGLDRTGGNIIREILIHRVHQVDLFAGGKLLGHGIIPGAEPDDLQVDVHTQRIHSLIDLLGNTLLRFGGRNFHPGRAEHVDLFQLFAVCVCTVLAAGIAIRNGLTGRDCEYHSCCKKQSYNFFESFHLSPSYRIAESFSNLV